MVNADRLSVCQRFMQISHLHKTWGSTPLHVRVTSRAATAQNRVVYHSFHRSTHCKVASTHLFEVGNLSIAHLLTAPTGTSFISVQGIARLVRSVRAKSRFSVRIRVRVKVELALEPPYHQAYCKG